MMCLACSTKGTVVTDFCQVIPQRPKEEENSTDSLVTPMTLILNNDAKNNISISSNICAFESVLPPLFLCSSFHVIISTLAAPPVGVIVLG